MSALEPTASGCRVHLHVAPRASRTCVAGLHDDRVKLQVAAPPVDGEANDAIVKFLCKALGVRKDAMRWVSGETGKRKTLEIDGVAPDEAADRLGLT